MYKDLYLMCAIGVVITAICTFILNTSVIAAYRIMPSSLREKVPNLMAMNQACADISSIIPSLLISTVVYLLLEKNTYNAAVHKMYWIFFLYTNYLVVFSLLLSTLDRLVNLKFPGRYHRVATRKKALILIAMSWMVSAIPPLCFHVTGMKAVYSFFTCVFAVLLILAVLVVVLILVTFRTLRGEMVLQMEMRASLSESENKDEEQKQHLEGQRRLVCILFMRTCTYMCTLLPHIILRLIVLHRDALNLHRSVGHWLSLTYIIYSLNGVLDPLLTVFLRQDFHRARAWVTLGRCSSNRNSVRVVEETVVSDEV